MCNCDLFCSYFCEGGRSKRHRDSCTPAPGNETPAHALRDACSKHTFPSDRNVLSDFGFAHPRFRRRTGWYHLLQVYNYLFELGVTPETVQGWQEKGILKDGITAEFKKHFVDMKNTYGPGPHLSLLTEHFKVLDSLQRLPSKSHVSRPENKYAPKDWLMENDKRRFVQKLPLVPAAKSLSFSLLLSLSHWEVPFRDVKTWLEFGFITCVNDKEEARLGGIYAFAMMGQRASNPTPTPMPTRFRAFWLNFQSKALLLPTEYGGKELLDPLHLRFLKLFLRSDPAERSLPVWGLRRLIYGGSPFPGSSEVSSSLLEIS